MNIRDETLRAFQIEHREQIEGIRSILASLEEEQARSNDPRWDDAFRMAHTLKGGARVCELRDLEAVGHRMESLFACVREGRLDFSRNVGEALCDALDAIEDWMIAFTAGQTPDSPAKTLEAIEQLLEAAKERVAAGEKAAAPPSPPSDETDAELTGATTALPEIETLRVDTQHLDEMLRSADALLPVNTNCDRVARELAELAAEITTWDRRCTEIREDEASILRQMEATPELASIARHVQAMTLQTRRIGRRQRLLRDTHARTAWALRVATQNLRDNVQQTRMVAANAVLPGLRRMVVNLARDEGKEVEFNAKGLDVRADRMVLQQLKDPLIHALRNAVVHGIEPPAERERLGKPRVGKISLALQTHGNRLEVLVSDDGRGVDTKKVAREAAQRGVLPENIALGETNPEQMSRLLFMPGFSTSATVSELAGRGIGLSVVQETIKKLRGSVRMESKLGAGATLRIDVPLYVSADRMLLVSCAGQVFAIPIHAIDKLLRVRRADVQRIDGRNMTLDSGQPLVLVELGQVLGCTGQSSTARQDTFIVAVVRCATGRMGAIVDAFVGEDDALIKDLDEPAAGAEQFLGAILLEDNDVALVVDPATLSPEAATTTTTSTQAPNAEARRPRQKSSVLVVDDSFTTRTLERGILETNGFDVHVAVDGLEALTILRTESIDLVVADVEMPRMDGLSMLRALRSDEKFESLPVILVTSLDRAEDRQRGMQLGANAYIVKRNFDHQILLDTIRRFL